MSHASVVADVDGRDPEKISARSRRTERKVSCRPIRPSTETLVQSSADEAGREPRAAVLVEQRRALLSPATPGALLLHAARCDSASRRA